MASTASVLTAEERKACLILSDLFLDVEETPFMLDLNAMALERLHMPLSDLDKILRYDLFPILFGNLLTIAAEWMPWEETHLINSVERQRIAPPGLLKRLVLSALWLIIGHTVTMPWEQIKTRLRTGSILGMITIFSFSTRLLLIFFVRSNSTCVVKRKCVVR